MTGYTVHTGSTEKFSKGWDNIFGTDKPSKKSTSKKSVAKKRSATKKTTTKKAAPKKSAKKK